MAKIPYVEVKKVVILTDRINKGQRLLKIDCPYCGMEHTHGGGKEGTDIQSFGGHRLSHCVASMSNPGYELVIFADISMTEYPPRREKV